MDQITRELGTSYRSARLIYGPVNEGDEDVKAYLTWGVNNPRNTALAITSLIKPKGQKEVNGFIKAISNSLLSVALYLPAPEDQDVNERVTEAVKPRRTMIGLMCLGAGGVPPEKTHNRSAEMGISILDEYQNKNYGREAINWAIDWGFKHAGLHTVEIVATSYNERALHLYQSIGFVITGRRREVVWYNRKFYDEVIMSMTEGEWEALRGIQSS